MKRNKTSQQEQTPWSPEEGAGAMEPQRVIGDLETVRIIADPTRLRLLELLVIEPQTVKRLAAMLELPQTKLYYHINLLEEHGLVRVVATRVVSGIIEKQYGAVAHSFRVAEGLLALSSPARDATFDLMAGTLLDGVKQDMRQALAAGAIDLQDDAPDERKVTFGRVPLQLTPERAAELHQRLGALIKEFCPSPDELGRPAPGTRLYHLFVACFPTYLADEQADS